MDMILIYLLAPAAAFMAFITFFGVLVALGLGRDN